MADIVIFHNIHNPKSWDLITKPEIFENENVEIVDWYGDIQGRDEWIAANPGVGPTAFPTIWIKAPAYRAPYYLYIYFNPNEKTEYEAWETPGIDMIFEGDYINVPEQWELIPEQDIAWSDVMQRLQFYKDRAELLPPEE